MIDYGNQLGKKIVIKEKGISHFIDLKDIICLKSDSYLTKIYLLDSQVITVSKLLRIFEKELLEYSFFRINKSVIINIKYLTKIIHSNRKMIAQLENMQFIITRNLLDEKTINLLK